MEQPTVRTRSASYGKRRCVDSFPCDRSGGAGKVFGA